MPSPQRTINDLEASDCRSYVLKLVNLTVPGRRLLIIEDTVYLVWCKNVREFCPQHPAAFVAEVTGIGVARFALQAIAARQFRRTAAEQRAGNRVGIGVVIRENFDQGFGKDIAERNALANVHVAERIEVNPAWLSQVFERAFSVSIPGVLVRTWREFFHRPATEYDG